MLPSGSESLASTSTSTWSFFGSRTSSTGTKSSTATGESSGAFAATLTVAVALDFSCSSVAEYSTVWVPSSAGVVTVTRLSSVSSGGSTYSMSVIGSTSPRTMPSASPSGSVSLSSTGICTSRSGRTSTVSSTA